MREGGRRPAIRSVALAGVAAVLAPIAVPASAVDLRASLEPAGEGEVRFEVVNGGDATVALLVRDTPLDPFLAHDALDVLAPRRGWPATVRLTWIGPVARRLPPGPEDVRTLGPGETVSALVSVADGYAVPEDGLYTVRWSGTLRAAAVARRAGADALGGARGGFVETAAGVPELRLALAATPPAPGTRLGPATYENCTADERAIIDEAARIAEDWSARSRAGLEALDGDERARSPRYRLWFGEHEPVRFDVVLGAFRGLERALAERRIDYTCGCTESGVFAYVNPSRPYGITLCPVFWQTSADGRDSRAGTVIHELSHFRTVAGTLDHAYAQAPSQRLAVERPELAVANADSYGYFAENRPAVPIDPDEAGAGAGAGADDPPGRDGPAFAELVPGRGVEGGLARGERAYFRADGAAAFELTSLAGDADLAVYADARLERRTCASERVEPVDECAANADGPSWVEVRGYSAASYRLVARPGTDSPEGGEGVPLLGSLDVGDAVSGTVERAALVAWRLVDGGFVELESSAGDADLYVHSVPPAGGPLGEDTLVCRSFGDSSLGETTERCRVAPGAPHYLLVTGYEAAAYTLSVSATDPAPAAPGAELAVVGDVSAATAGGAAPGAAATTTVAADDPGAPGAPGQGTNPGEDAGAAAAVAGPGTEGGSGGGAAADAPAGGDGRDADGGGGGGGVVGGWWLVPLALARRRRVRRLRAGRS